MGDIKFKQKSSAKLKDMMKSGATVLFVSHALMDILEICNRCIWLENGKIIMDGETQEVIDAYVERSKKK